MAKPDSVKGLKQRSIDALIDELKRHFAFILDDSRIMGLFLYGSYAEGTHYEKSDIDLCFVVPNKAEILSMYHSVMAHAANFRDKYDIRFFEEFPLPLKMEVMNKGITILTHDVNGIYEYFFKFRKIWEHNMFRMKYII